MYLLSVITIAFSCGFIGLISESGTPNHNSTTASTSYNNAVNTMIENIYVYKVKVFAKISYSLVQFVIGRSLLYSLLSNYI